MVDPKGRARIVPIHAGRAETSTIPSGVWIAKALGNADAAVRVIILP